MNYKNYLHTLFIVCTIIVSVNVNAQNTGFKANLSAPHEAHIINIKVKQEFANLCATHSIDVPVLIECFNSIGVVTISKKFPNHKPLGANRSKNGEPLVDLSLIYRLELNANTNLQKAINALLNTKILEYAEPHYTQQLFYSPNDPSAALQYYLTKINAYQAWNISQSDTTIIIGVTDTGTELAHPDLINSIKYNYLDPIDGVDNDLDGYTDNYYGWDLGENDNTPQCNANFHGLHSAGISSATVDNNIGIAGVGFKAKYLPIKISDAAGILNTSYEGIVYAVDHGCQIVNCSWGGTGASQFGQDIVNYAAINMDALVIASAGNNGDDVLFYPASYSNVLNVAASDQVDHKKANSTYGITVDLCAPGEDIYSTWVNGTYVTSGGTSTAAPVVSGAAAIVKSFYPFHTGVQIGEILKASADVIDTIAFNAPWQDKLGSGRINLYRALTDTNLVSIVLTNSSVTDNNDNAFVIGDTLTLLGTFTNYLYPANAVQVQMSCVSAFVQLLDSTVSLGNMATMQTLSNTPNPFKAIILAGAPTNATVEFKLTITDASGKVFTNFISVVINVDFINIAINEVATTITSKGNIGFNNSASQGLGFVYNSNNLLYEGGLLIGASPAKVSDRVRGVSGNDVDFATVSNVTKQIPGIFSEFDISGSFNDVGAAANAIPVKVLQNAYAWSTAGHSKYLMVKYRIINTGSISLDTLHVGLFTDWDIMNGGLNKIAYDPALKMGYCYSTQNSGLYAGVKLLSNAAPAIHFAMDNIAGGGVGGIDPAGGLTSVKKFKGISSNRPNAGGAGNGNDVIDFMSTGPIHLLPGDTVEVAFALIAGDSLPDLQASATAAQQKYDNNPIVVKSYDLRNNSFSAYPNPANELVNIYFQQTSLPNNAVSLTLTDLQGKVLKQIQVPHHANTYQLEVGDVNKGVYFLTITSLQFSQTQKLVISK